MPEDFPIKEPDNIGEVLDVMKDIRTAFEESGVDIPKPENREPYNPNVWVYRPDLAQINVQGDVNAIVCVMACPEDPEKERRYANLITAAPQLLEFVKRFLAENPDYFETWLLSEWEAAFREATLLVEKAEGQRNG